MDHLGGERALISVNRPLYFLRRLPRTRPFKARPAIKLDTLSSLQAVRVIDRLIALASTNCSRARLREFRALDDRDGARRLSPAKCSENEERTSGIAETGLGFINAPR